MRAGRLAMGINSPDKNIIGNLKKLEKVCASKTSSTETAINKPRKVDVIAINRTTINVKSQFIPDKSIRKEANRTGINALMTPNTMAPVVFASISRFKLIGASKSLSNDLLFLSKVMVTASIDVLPKRTDRAMTPGSISRTFTPPSDRTKNIRVQARGKIIPQLIFGGLK